MAACHCSPDAGASPSAASASARRKPRCSGRSSSASVGQARRAGSRSGHVRARRPRASGGRRPGGPRARRASASVSGAPFSASTRACDVHARDLDEQREVAEGRPEGVRGRRRRPRPGRAASSGRWTRGPTAARPCTSRPAVAAASRSNSSNRRGMASVPSGIELDRASPGGGGRTGTAAARAGRPGRSCGRRRPRPLDVDIFLPPMLRNSYGKLSGGSRSNTSRAMALDRSREPPAVARSLPLGSIVTPNRLHWAAHSRFQGSFAAPPNGAIRPGPAAADGPGHEVRPAGDGHRLAVPVGRDGRAHLAAVGADRRRAAASGRGAGRWPRGGRCRAPRRRGRGPSG